MKGRRQTLAMLISWTIVGSWTAMGGEVPLAELGKLIFQDTNLSEPRGQACISCHSPKTAFADPRRISPGAVAGRVGRRNAPSLMYASLISPMRLEDLYDEKGEPYFIVEGGFFHDGRARQLKDQVRVPFFEANEMNLADAGMLADRLRCSGYEEALKGQLGEEKWGNDEAVNEVAFAALVAFLREPMFRPFHARIDDYWAGDKKALSLSERRGLDVFETDAKCAKCHLVGAGTWLEPLLSDFGYDNLGVPSLLSTKDPGLGGITGQAEELGQFKVPSLRNVALTAPYFHNGSVATLREVLEFYNKRNLEPERWGKTDYPETVNHDDMGDLKLSDQQLDDLLALMEAFTDRNLLEIPEGEVFPKIPEGVPSTEERKAFFKEVSGELDLSKPRRPEGS